MFSKKNWSRYSWDAPARPSTILLFLCCVVSIDTAFDSALTRPSSLLLLFHLSPQPMYVRFLQRSKKDVFSFLAVQSPYLVPIHG